MLTRADVSLGAQESHRGSPGQMFCCIQRGIPCKNWGVWGLPRGGRDSGEPKGGPTLWGLSAGVPESLGTPPLYPLLGLRRQRPMASGVCGEPEWGAAPHGLPFLLQTGSPTPASAKPSPTPALPAFGDGSGESGPAR